MEDSLPLAFVAPSLVPYCSLGASVRHLFTTLVSPVNLCEIPKVAAGTDFDSLIASLVFVLPPMEDSALILQGASSE